MKGNQIMFEVTPPHRKSSQQHLSKVVEGISQVIEELGSKVDFINIPEVVEENFEGKVFYRNMKPRKFGVILREKTGKEVVVNRGVAYSESLKDFCVWLDKTVKEYNVKNLVFVGGNLEIKYPGPEVIEANKRALEFADLNIGNICIPQRKDEVQRLIAKTKSGCSFFTTQIILEFESLKKLLKEYAEGCKKENLEPAVFFLSFAPVCDKHDIEFFKWLGVYFPSGAEEKFRESRDMDKLSIEVAKNILSDVLSFVKNNKLDVPISLNIESISFNNLELAKEMLVVLSKELLR